MSLFYEVVTDPTETANKCTITPLSYRNDFKIFLTDGKQTVGPLKSQILLHPSGTPLTTLRDKRLEVRGVASIDCIWKKVDPYLNLIEGPIPELVSIPEGFVTAYPRRNKHNEDPFGGLATIEAIFIASAVLGLCDVSLLCEYYFGQAFLELNRARFLEIGVLDIPSRAPLRERPRNSVTRKLNRGKY